MHIKKREIKLDNGDEVTVRLYNGTSIPNNWVELRVWDDYEGRGGGVALYTTESIDSVIDMLQEMRKEMV